MDTDRLCQLASELKSRGMGFARRCWELGSEDEWELASASYSRKMEWKGFVEALHDMWARETEIWKNNESNSSSFIARRFSFQRDAGKA